MANQPSVKAQESRVVPPPGAVPVSPRPPALPEGPVGPARELAAAALRNPVAPNPASLARGERMYLRHCAVCHGASGRGDGLVGLEFQPRPADLTQAYVQAQADGRLYYTLSRGSVLMPGYDLALSEADRWHLINYLKQRLGRE